MNIKRIIREEIDDFGWISDVPAEMDICEAMDTLKPGDNIVLNELLGWSGYYGDDKIDVHNAEAEVLDVDKCSNIQEDNVDDKVILIHIKEPYSGFDDEWISTFINPRHREICGDNRCMFLFCGMYEEDKDVRISYSYKTPLKESKDPFKWIKDIEITHPDLFKGRVEDFIQKYARHWEGAEVTFEPIQDVYGSGVREIGRVWLDDGDGSWYWDLLQDHSDGTFIVELFEKHGNSYEAIDHSRFETFEESLQWIYDGMIDG